jgi:glycosyltransferase involved in cell wall biosynthesis
MKIAIVAPPWFAIPPLGYGGIERVVSYLADGLAGRGHDVTLFAPGGSRCLGKLESYFPEPRSADIGHPLVEAAHVIHAYARWREFDIIHDHTAIGPIAGAHLEVPVVQTVHGPITEQFATYCRALSSSVHLVAISAHQRSAIPEECAATVIPHAVPTEGVPFRKKRGEHLLFVGRACPEKGVLDAIEIARRSQRKLKLFLKVNEPPERQFLEERVQPALRGVDHEICAQVSPQKLQGEYARALATLFPIHWPEPFGLVMAESMAAGTPVIAFREGSVEEVVLDGKTGRICDSLEEAVGAVESIGNIDREACREHVELNFSIPVAVKRHEHLFQALLTSGETASSAVPRHLTFLNLPTAP